LHVVCVNQDRGVAPGRPKGAAVHLQAMRSAFRALGARVSVVDESDEARLRARLDELAATGEIALVYERYALGRDAAARFAAARGIPFVLEMNAPLALEEQRWRGGESPADALERDRALLANAARVVAVSNAVADYARERGADEERVFVCPNGVDAERFLPRRLGRSRREELVPAGRFALGFHGRLRPWHGFDRFVDVAAALLDRGVDVHVVAGGEGPFAAALDGRVPAERVSLVGWVDHDAVGEVVAAFDALPLTYDPGAPCYFSPLKLAEAMACEVVPVVPDLGDLPAAIADGETGLLYPAGDTEWLVAALAGLAADPARRERLGRAAREAATRQSWRSIASFVLECASEVVDR
jgi:glycosyltransferase involved in cell wall biosynthesis